MKEMPLVRANDHGIRPAGPPDACFYCRAKVGESHQRDCVIVQKRVKMRAVIEYECYEPFSWDKEEIEFARNDGTWCADNLLETLKLHGEESGCLCGSTKIEFIGEVTGEAAIPENKP